MKIRLIAALVAARALICPLSGYAQPHGLCGSFQMQMYMNSTRGVLQHSTGTVRITNQDPAAASCPDVDLPIPPDSQSVTISGVQHTPTALGYPCDELISGWVIGENVIEAKPKGNYLGFQAVLYVAPINTPRDIKACATRPTHLANGLDIPIWPDGEAVTTTVLPNQAFYLLTPAGVSPVMNGQLNYLGK